MSEHAGSGDRGRLLTEQRLSASADVDALPTQDILRTINDEDAKVATVVALAIPGLAALVDDVVRAIEVGGRLIYAGAGTSGRLGVLDASECPPTFHVERGLVVGLIAGGEQALTRAVEGAEDDAQAAGRALTDLRLTARDVVVAIAAGATTPYGLGAIDAGLAQGCITGMITCVQEPDARSALCGRSVKHLIALPVGPEVLTGSTRMKAGTATKLALNMISTACMIRLGRTWGNLMVDLRASNAKLRDRAVRILRSQKPDLAPADAIDLLERANGSVKVALVMALREVDSDTAQRLLDQHSGHLRPLLGSPR